MQLLVKNVAKTSFSAYVLGKNVLKTGGKVHFQKARPILVVLLVPSLFPFLHSKWLKYAVFVSQRQKR